MPPRLRPFPAALLLALAFLALALPAAATAQGATRGTTLDTPTDSLEEQAAARVADAACDRRLVVLGQLPEHGEARGFGVKARVVERLVARCGFRAVLFEAGSYDFFGVERRIAAAPGVADDSLELALARAIGGFWWTRELAGWRRWLAREAAAGRVRVGGLDDQPGMTTAFAKATLPAMVGAAVPPARADECREAVARYMRWGYGGTVRYDDAERARLAGCARLAAERARRTARPERRTADEVMLDDIASYYERERTIAARGDSAQPDRDLVMARHVAWWMARLPRDAKVVVWTASSHAARAPGADAPRPLAVPPLGERLARRWGDRVAIVGFTALGGRRSRAGGPVQPLAELPPGSLEERALAGGAAWAWLDRAALRAMGAAPSRLFGVGRPGPRDWSTAFDGVVVVREEAPPTFEPRR